MTTVSLQSIVRRDRPGAPGTKLTARERAFADRAIAELARVVGDGDFLERVEEATYSSALWLRPDNTMVNLAGLDVAALIRAGGEGGSPPNGVVDIHIALIDLPPGILASTFPHEPETRTDTDFFKACLDENDPGGLAAVWMHEWMHAVGFEHETQNGDEQDVPYTVQGLVRELSPKATSAPRAHALALPPKHLQSVAAEPTRTTAETPRTRRHSGLWRCPVRVRPPSA